MADPEAKAAGFNSGVAVVREMAGAERFERFVETLPPELARYVKKPLLATAWLPLADLIEFHTRAWRELFREDLNAAFEMGRKQFIHDLSTLYKVFIRLGSPGFVSRRAAVVWGTYVRNGGRMSVTREEEKLLEVRVDDYPFPSPMLWQFMRGTIHGSVEASSVRGAQTRIVDGGGGARWCVIRVTWP